MKIERQFNRSAARPVPVGEPLIKTGGAASALGMKVTFYASPEYEHGGKIALHATPDEAAKLGRRLIAAAEPTRYTVTMRGTLGGVHVETITIHPDQYAEREAAQRAASDGATVEKLEPQDADALRDMLRRILPHVHIADAGALYDEARAMVQP